MEAAESIARGRRKLQMEQVLRIQIKAFSVASPSVKVHRDASLASQYPQNGSSISAWASGPIPTRSQKGLRFRNDVERSGFGLRVEEGGSA
jgi:hypothetical protein